ncbi:MAG: calcium-binding protein [Paracoccaceae bacterium]
MYKMALSTKPFIFNLKITGTEYSETLRGGGGDDTITGLYGDDTIDGGFGDDLIYGDRSMFLPKPFRRSITDDDSLVGGAGDDTIFGGLGDDTIVGGDGSDVLFGGAGDDVLIGGNQDNASSDAETPDVFVFDMRADAGDQGRDTVIYDLNSAVFRFETDNNPETTAYEGVHMTQGRLYVDSGPTGAVDVILDYGNGEVNFGPAGRWGLDMASFMDRLEDRIDLPTTVEPAFQIAEFEDSGVF